MASKHMLPRSTIYIVLISVCALLCIPWIAMNFSEEVHWTIGDFVVAGILLTTIGCTIAFIWQKSEKTTWKVLFIGLILMALLLVWVELAVGIL